MASKTKFKINDTLIKKLQQAANKKAKYALDYMEEMVNDSLGIIYAKVIENFYDDYDPVSYKRTYTTYQAGLLIPEPRKHIESPIAITNTTSFKTANSMSKEISMTITSDNMQRDDPYRADRDWVFTRTFEEGIHGFARSDGDVFKGKGNFFDGIGKIPHVVKRDRTPAIQWNNAINDFKKRKTGPRLQGIPNTCSLKWIKKEALEYANEMMK